MPTYLHAQTYIFNKHSQKSSIISLAIQDQDDILVPTCDDTVSFYGKTCNGQHCFFDFSQRVSYECGYNIKYHCHSFIYRHRIGFSPLKRLRYEIFYFIRLNAHNAGNIISQLIKSALCNFYLFFVSPVVTTGLVDRNPLILLRICSVVVLSILASQPRYWVQTLHCFVVINNFTF